MYTAPNGHDVFTVAIEGPDRVGKATQTHMLKSALRKKGLKVATVEVPYEDGVTFPKIYEMLRSGEASEFPVIFQALQTLNRRFFQKNQLPGLAEHHDVLIFDRWNLSTQVYGAASGVTEVQTQVLLQGIFEPDVTFVFDGPPFPKPDLDSWESNSAFQDHVRKLYKELSKDRSGHFSVDASRSVEVISHELLNVVLEALGSR